MKDLRNLLHNPRMNTAPYPTWNARLEAESQGVGSGAFEKGNGGFLCARADLPPFMGDE